MEASAWCGAGTNGFGIGYTPSPCFGTPRLLKQATAWCGRLSVDAQEPFIVCSVTLDVHRRLAPNGRLIFQGSLVAVEKKGRRSYFSLNRDRLDAVWDRGRALLLGDIRT